MSWFQKAVAVTKQASDVWQAMPNLMDIFGNPETPDSVVQIPKQDLLNKFRLEQQGMGFSIYSQNSGARVPHIVYQSQHFQQAYSVFRGDSKTPLEAQQLFAVFQQHAQLFEYAKSSEDKLKELCGIVHKHQSWPSLHVACAADIPAFVQQISFQDLNSKREPESGACAVHVAAGHGHHELTSILLALGADPTIVDHFGCNALHYAVKGNSSLTVKSLKSDQKAFSACCNAANSHGMTPLFYGVTHKADKALDILLSSPEVVNPNGHFNGQTILHLAMTFPATDLSAVKCVEVIARHCPNMIVEGDLKTGNTPLHLLPEKDVLHSMLAGASTKNVSLDLANKEGRTPLHEACARGRLYAVISFLSYGASPDATDIQGNTPLHLASEKNMDGEGEAIVEILLLYHSDPCQKNNRNVMALELIQKKNAVLGKQIRMIKGIEKLPNPPAQAMEDFCQAMSLSNCEIRCREAAGNGVKCVNLLALDGGGIRGLVLCQILKHIQHKMGPNEDVVSYFHWIAGTSTGAILAIALSKGFSLLQCQSLYFRFKDVVFTGLSRPYDARVLEQFLRQEIGETTKMDDIKNHKLLVTTVEADYTPAKLKMFRNYRLPLSEAENVELGYSNPKGELAWKAARCSSAAPTFFASYEGKYVDGGLIANNPSLDLLTDVQNMNNAAEFSKKTDERVCVGCLLSVGTGKVPSKKMEAKLDFEKVMPTSFIDAVANFATIKSLGNTLIDQVTATEGRPVDRSRAWCHSMNIPYFRFSTPLSEEIGLDEKADKKLVKMLWETELYLAANACHVNTLVQFLKRSKSLLPPE